MKRNRKNSGIPQRTGKNFAATQGDEKFFRQRGSRRDEAEPEKQRNPAENREEFCGHARGRKMLPAERFTEG